MEYKVSYQKNIGPSGTCYDQVIKATMDEKELQKYNDTIRDRKMAIHAKGTKTSDEIKFMCFARFLLRGKNHTTLTQRNLFVNLFNLDGDKRILDRNTLIIVELKRIKKHGNQD